MKFQCSSSMYSVVGAWTGEEFIILPIKGFPPFFAIAILYRNTLTKIKHYLVYVFVLLVLWIFATVNLNDWRGYFLSHINRTKHTHTHGANKLRSPQTSHSTQIEDLFLLAWGLASWLFNLFSPMKQQIKRFITTTKPFHLFFCFIGSWTGSKKIEHSMQEKAETPKLLDCCLPDVCLNGTLVCILVDWHYLYETSTINLMNLQ